MFRTTITLIITIALQLFLILMVSAFMTLWLNSFSLIESIAFVSIAWLLYLATSDFILFYIYKVTRPKFDSELNLVFKNFSFRNREKEFEVYDSEYSPVFMRLSLFKSSKFMLNRKAVESIGLTELKAYLDLELSYSNTLGSFTEVLLQRVYLVAYVPLCFILERLVGKVVSDYLLGPLTLLYNYSIEMCRKDYVYTGKFVSTLPQIIFKVKILDKKQGKISLFNYSEHCSALMMKEGGEDSLTRFDPDELLR